MDTDKLGRDFAQKIRTMNKREERRKRAEAQQHLDTIDFDPRFPPCGCIDFCNEELCGVTCAGLPVKKEE